MSIETFGKKYSELVKDTTVITNSIELQRQSEKEHLDNIIWAIKHALKSIDCSMIKGHDKCKSRSAIEGDFYIVVLIKKEPMLSDVFRQYFMVAGCCPTPTYDQMVYKFNSQLQDLELIWVIPDRESSIMYKQNKNIVDPEEHQLLQYVLDFYDGTLNEKAKILNKEKKSGIILFKKEIDDVILTN